MQIYSNTLKTQHLIPYQFLPDDRIFPIIDNEIVKFYQLKCIRCQTYPDIFTCFVKGIKRVISAKYT